MGTIDIKSVIIGILISICFFFIFRDWCLPTNGRYQFSPVDHRLIIDTQTGSVKSPKYGIPFNKLSLEKKKNSTILDLDLDAIEKQLETETD